MPHPGGAIVGHSLASDDSLLVSYRPPDPEEPRQYDANIKLRDPVDICDFIEPSIDDLIEIRVDILNPVQPLQWTLAD